MSRALFHESLGAHGVWRLPGWQAVNQLLAFHNLSEGQSEVLCTFVAGLPQSGEQSFLEDTTLIWSLEVEEESEGG